MDLRTKTADAITGGNSVVWLLAVFTKALVELGSAILLGWVLAWGVLEIFGLQAVDAYFDVSTQQALWLALTLLVAWHVTLCTWAILSGSGE